MDGKIGGGDQIFYDWRNVMKGHVPGPIFWKLEGNKSKLLHSRKR